MNQLKSIVHEIIEETFSCSMEIGKILEDLNGRTVKVKSGHFLDPDFGRVSNWWTWNEVLSDGSLGPDEQGYGW